MEALLLKISKIFNIEDQEIYWQKQKEKGMLQQQQAIQQGLTEQQFVQQQAIGNAALFHFAENAQKNIPEPGAGLAGNLGMLNASVLPAVQAYDAEKHRVEGENLLFSRWKIKAIVISEVLRNLY